MKTVAVVIPVCNKESSIKKVMHDFHEFLPHAEMFLVDNNSTDKTVEIAKEFYKETKCPGKVLIESKKGKANAIRKAFREIAAEIYVLIDAEANCPASEVWSLLHAVEDDEADIVVGTKLSSGNKENKKQIHYLGNLLIRKLIGLFFHSKITDVLSGYRVLNRRFVNNFPVLSSGLNVEVEMTLHALDKHFRIKEIPLAYPEPEQKNIFKTKVIQEIFSFLNTIFWIMKDYRPFQFFSLLSGLFFLAGIIFGFPVILEFMETKYIEHLPLAILATGVMLTSFIFLGIGLILDSVVRSEKITYELRLLDNK